MEEFEEDNKPFGYIFIATNSVNEKVYVAQSTSDRWNEKQNPIECRWKEEVR